FRKIVSACSTIVCDFFPLMFTTKPIPQASCSNCGLYRPCLGGIPTCVMRALPSPELSFSIYFSAAHVMGYRTSSLVGLPPPLHPLTCSLFFCLSLESLFLFVSLSASAFQLEWHDRLAVPFVPLFCFDWFGVLF